MPELPEVETIVRLLRTPAESSAGVVNKTIAFAQINWIKSVAEPSVESFLEQITNQTIQEISRRGKYLCFRLTDKYLLVHLRMSGDLFIESELGEHDNKHDRVVFSFTDQSRLVFNDPRKFGRVWLVDNVEYVTGNLGLEPLEESLTPALFFEMLQKAKRAIKPLLLDQSFLAGLGNIYTDEALFLARIHPLTIANRLDFGQAEQLLAAIREVLNEGIQRNGASIDWVFRGGDFQNHFQVYQQDGQPCSRCGTILQRMVVGQRGTHFCPQCQRKIS